MVKAKTLRDKYAHLLSFIEPICQNPLLIRPAVAKLGAELLDLQLWCWGRDINRPRGNLLIEYGFTRHSVPKGSSGSSMYEFFLSSESKIKLWGFGLFYADLNCGGVFLKRYEFKPRLTGYDGVNQVWSADGLLNLRQPKTKDESLKACKLTLLTVQWIASYEKWVTQTAGMDYRKHCVTQWKPTHIEAECMVELWNVIALAFTETLLVK